MELGILAARSAVRALEHVGPTGSLDGRVVSVDNLRIGHAVPVRSRCRFRQRRLLLVGHSRL